MSHQQPELDEARHRQLLHHISVPRWSTYLVAAEQDADVALRLYEWNLAASAAAHTVLSIVEIALRNALDRSLRRWNPSQGATCSSDWTATPCRLIKSLTRDGVDLRTARERSSSAMRGGRIANHDDVVAHLMFGTWRFLLPTSLSTRAHAAQRAALFDQAFGPASPLPAFPHWEFAPVHLGRDVAELHLLRNRVSHHEPLLRTNLTGNLSAARRVLGAIDPALPGWLHDLEQLTAVIASRPVAPR